eukprot:2681943-Prymnesium_polylepis.1
MYMFPSFILVPVGLFYAGLALTATNVEDARAAKWFYPIVDEPPFWQVGALAKRALPHMAGGRGSSPS